MSRFWKIALIVVAVIVVALIAHHLLNRGVAGAGGRHGRAHAAAAAQPAQPGGQGGQDSAPVPVTVEPVLSQNVPIYLTGLGTVQALNTVTIQPQVGGQMLSLNFVEGQEVKKGALLAQVDPRTFQANYDQALANQHQAVAQLATAQSTLKRNQALVASGYVAALDMDTYRNTVGQLQATVAADAAAAQAAKVQLDYTRIISPVDGVAGIRNVDPGNVVTTSSTIVTVTQIHPIYITFSLPEQNLETVRGAFAGGAQLEVAALDRTDAHPIASGGVLKVIDNQIDSTTGTFKLRAQFPNLDKSLWPGQFVNVQLKVSTTADGLVIPAQAVQRGPDGDYVYQLQADKTVKMQPVTVANEVGASHVMIGKGLAVGDQVVTEGQFRLKPGSKVEALKPGQVPAAPTAAELQKAGGKAQQQGGGRGGRGH
jgi:multidrug efflux system membrane fusion protein